MFVALSDMEEGLHELIATFDPHVLGTRLTGAAHFGAAVRSGSISPAQAAEVAETLGERPDAEDELLGAAQTATMRELRSACNEVASRGKGAEKRHARAQAQRYCSSSVGRDGQWRLNAGLTVTDGALVDKVLEYFQNEAFDDARIAGTREPFTAYRADALVRMARAAMDDSNDHGHNRQASPAGAVTDTGTDSGATDSAESDAAESDAKKPRRRRRGRPRKRSSSLRHAIIVTVPHTTFLTGTPTDGETCQVPGVGPVPFSQVQHLLEADPIIKCIVTQGRDITATATMTRNLKDDPPGRPPPARLRVRCARVHQHPVRPARPRARLRQGRTHRLRQSQTAV